MTPKDRLAAARRIFLDTAPVIYFVQAHPTYLSTVEPIFDRFDAASAIAVVSPVTLAECLILPLRQGNATLASAFVSRMSGGATLMVPIDADTGRLAAELRASHGLTLTDALQIAAAASAGCDLFLTNDATLKRVTSLPVVTLDELLSNAGTP